MTPPARRRTALLRAALVAVAVAAAAGPAAPASAPAGAQARAPAAAATGALRAAAARARAAGRDVFPVRFASPELAENLQGNGGEARAIVRLPAAVERCRRAAARCWLVLYLPGFDGSHERAVELLAPRLAALEASGVAPPTVLVAVDGRTRLGGGFYVDSPASGRFETAILDRLLPALRAGLGLDLPPERTLVAGHSMGGFGALWLALRRPRAFAGVAAFNPAARTVPLAAQLVAALDRRRGDRAPDPATALEAPQRTPFGERLLWAMCGALLPDPARPGGVALPFDPARRPWTLGAAAAEALGRFDLSRPPEGARADAARALPRIVVTGGARDRLVPPADVEAVAAALSAARGPGREVKLILRADGDHGSRLADDLADALGYLAGGP